MHKSRFFIRKMCIIQIIFIMLLATALSVLTPTSKVQAVTQIKKEGIESFPESYKAALTALKAKHPTWNFTAFYTGLTWQEVINRRNKCTPI